MTRSKPFALAMFLYAITMSTWAMATNQAQAPSLQDFPADVPRPLRVGVGVYISDVNKLDESAGTYRGLVELRYRWREPALAFSTATTGLAVQTFAGQEALDKLATIWSPQIAISNLLSSDNSIATGLIIRADGTVELIQSIKGTFETRLKLANFPFDRQNLPVVMLSSRYSSNTVVLVQESSQVKTSGFAPELKIPGWHIQSLNFKREQVIAVNGLPAEQFTANLRIQRIATSILSTIFIPLLLTLLVPTVISLVPSFELPARLTSWAGSILALIALNFTLSLRFPGLSEGSLVGQIIMIGHMYQLVSVLLTVTLFNPQFMERRGDPFVVRELSNFLHWAIPAGFIGVLALQTLLIAAAW